MLNLSTEQRRIIIEGILLSDYNYLDKLADRKAVLLLELQILEGNIRKKVQEIQCMKGQLCYAG